MQAFEFMTKDEFIAEMLHLFPQGEVSEDKDGQLVINTGLQMGAHPSLAAGDPIPESHYVTIAMDKE